MKNCAGCIHWNRNVDKMDKEWGICSVAEKEDDDFWEPLVSPRATFKPKKQLMRLTTSNWAQLETHQSFYCIHWKKISLKVMI